MNFRELAAISRTEYDFSLESLSNIDPNVANLGIGWMWRPQRDILGELFLSTKDKALNELMKEVRELSCDKPMLENAKLTKSFYRGERMKDTKELIANAMEFASIVKDYLKELNHLNDNCQNMSSSGAWEDKDPLHYEAEIKRFGEGFGGRKLKRKSLLGMYTVVLLDKDSIIKSELVPLTNNAKASDYQKAAGVLYETYLDLKKAQQVVGKTIETTMSLRNQFRALNPKYYAIISKYYAGACNPYIGLVRLSNQILVDLIKCAREVS